MNSTRLRDYAEIIGICAIVASLLALVVELRQTQTTIRAATYQARALDAIQLNNTLQDSEHILPLLATTDIGNPDEVSALSALDLLRIRVFFTGRMVDLDNEFYQYQNGFLDEEHFEYVTREEIRRNAPQWRAVGVVEGRPSFRAFVDSILAE